MYFTLHHFIQNVYPFLKTSERLRVPKTMAIVGQQAKLGVPK
jgi:hypothetical protein